MDDGRPTPWCAAVARALDEPLPGTAPVAPRWLCVEHRGTWPDDVRLHRDDAVRAFLDRAVAAGWRPLLIRRPGRRPSDGPTRVVLADTTPPAARVTVQHVVDPAQFADIALPAPDEPLPGETLRDPMLLVCTHGRRDRCCAVDGRALARAVTATGEPDVWESTHLGGHRFAPTALVLPTGYVYGRLDVAGALAALKAASVGEAEPALCRGRSTWTAAGQVAELAVRFATGLRGADDLQVGSASDPVPLGQVSPAPALAPLPAPESGVRTRVVAPPPGPDSDGPTRVLVTPSAPASSGPIRVVALQPTPDSADPTRVLATPPGPDSDSPTRVVVTARDGRRWEVTVSAAACPGNRPVSCGAAALPVAALHASAVRRLP